MPTGGLKWNVTTSRTRQDYRRLRELLAAGGAAPRFLVLHPSFVTVFLHRLSHHCFRNRHRFLARFFWHVNVIVNGADISPPADIDAGFVISSPAGVAVSGRAGVNLTLMPLAGLGGELGRRQDIGAGPGLPWLGDNVVLEPNSGVLGPVRIGHAARIGAAVIVTTDVPDGAIVIAQRPRVHRRSAR